MDPLSITASTITVIQSLLATYDTIKHVKDLPKAFAEVGRNLPLVKETLDLAQQALSVDGPDENVKSAIQPALAECLKRAKTIEDIFAEIEPGNQQNKGAGDWSALVRFYRKKVVPYGKANKVEALMQDILDKLKVLAIHQVFKARADSLGHIEKLEDAIKSLAEVEPSLPDSEFDGGPATNVTQHISDNGRGLVSTGNYSEIAMGNTAKYQSGGGAMNFECDPKSDPVEWLKHISRPLYFGKIHIESLQIAQKTPKAGRWFLNSAEFKDEWRDGTLRKLWCHGIPCIYVYFNHGQHQDHCLTRLLCTLILQRLHGTNHVSPKIQEAHGAWKSNQQTPCERDYLKMLKSQAKSFERIFFVVDALDECLDDTETNTLNSFLEACQELPDNFRLLFTSRPVPKLAALIKPGCELPITANDDEINSYLLVLPATDNNNNNNKTVRLIHATAEEYIKRNQAIGFPNEEAMSTSMLTRTCLACLTRIPLSIGSPPESSVDDICRQYPLFGYAANFWGIHLDKTTSSRGDLYKLAWRFVSDKPKLDAAMHVMSDPRISHEADVSGVHIAAFFGLEKLVRKAMANDKKVDFNAQTRRGETPLHWAVTHGRRSFAEFLVRQGAELNVPNVDRRTALHKAIMAGDGDLIDVILTSGGLNLELEDSEGYTCLRWAARYGQLRTVEALLRSGADVDAADKDGYTALRWAMKYNRSTTAWLLIQARADVNKPDNQGTQPLHAAVQSCCGGPDGDGSKASMNLLWLLLENKANVNAQAGKLGQTPLHLAAVGGSSSVVWLLLENGADPRRPDSKNRTALHRAITSKNAAVCRTLLQRDGDYLVHAVDQHGLTPLHVAALGGSSAIVGLLLENGADLRRVDSNRRTALHCAIQGEHAEVCSALVQRGGGFLVLAVDDEKRSPLHHAASWGSPAIVGALLDHRAPIDSQDSKGLTALHVAVSHGYEKVVELLLQRGAGTHIGVAKRKRTAMHIAATMGHLEIVETLLRHGAVLDARDSRGETPLHLADAHGHRMVKKFLVKHGADAQ
ncbi:Ankyrin-2, partial [Colletotrichum shisoi]